jgi:dTMP kinase
LVGRYSIDGQGVDPATLALLFAADRMDHLQREVEPQLAAGRVVVSDRWYHSSLAYQSDRVVDLGWIAACNARARRPDLTIFLRIDPEIAAERRVAAGRTQELFDDVETQRRVNEGYGRAIKLVMTLGERVEVLDGKLPVEEVAAQVAALVDNLVGALAGDDAGLAACGARS